MSALVHPFRPTRRRLAALAILALVLTLVASAGRVSVARATLASVNNGTTGTGQNQFDFHGAWTYETDVSTVGAFDDDDTYSDTTGDYYLVRFTGTSITLYDVLNWGGGQGSAQICDANGANCGSATTFDDYSANRTGDQQVYTSGTLASGSYSLKVTVTGVNGGSGHDYLAPDRVAVDDGSTGSSNPIIGAIRWDGWWQDGSGVTNPYLASTLFTDFTNRQPTFGWFDSRVSNEQAIMNQEIDDAANNHLDFWAFDWYPPSIDTCASPCLSYDHPDYYAKAEQLYKSSPEKSRLKFADLVQTWWLASGDPSDPTSVQAQYESTWVPDLVADFQDSQYVKVNGNHPLLFWFGANALASSGQGWGSQTKAQQELNYLITATTNAGLGTPYIVDVNEDAGSASTYGFQGVSGYDTAAFGVTGHQCWPTLYTNDFNELSNGSSQGLTQLPAITAVSDPRPRDASGRYSYGFWYDEPTFGQWLKELHDMWVWADGSSRVTNPPVMLTYAWNEIDEGGPGIEPTAQDGYKFLNGIDDVMTGTYPATYTDQLNNDNCSVVYGGTWSRAFPLHGSSITTSPYQNDEAQSSTSGASAQVAWNDATGFSVIGSKGPARGQFEVYVNGTDEGTFSAYAPSASYNDTLYSISGLPDAQNTIEVVALGTHESASSGSTVSIDTINVEVADPYVSGSAGGTTVNDHTTGTGQNQFDYHGSWTGETDAGTTGAYNSDDTYSNTTNDYYLVRFTGTSIALDDVLNSGGGQGSAQICDANGSNCGAATTFSDYSATRTGNQQVYTSGALASGSHSLKVTVTGVNGAGGFDYLAPDRVVIN